MKRALHSLLSCLVNLCLASMVVAQDGSQSPASDQYSLSPHQIDNSRLPAVSSSMRLNGSIVSHLTEWQAQGLVLTGDSRNTTFAPYYLRTVDSKVMQSVSRDNVFRSDQTSRYLQLRGVQDQRTIELTVSEPKTMLGMQLQTTLTGECEQVGQESVGENSQCSFTPSLVVDQDALDPDFFLPTTISQEGTLGQVVSADTLLALAQPGFQNLGPNGENIGLDIYLPNIGLLPGNEQSTTAGIQQEETYRNTLHLSYSSVRQVLQSNADRASFSRTVRGVPYLHGSDNAALGSLAGLLGQLLPDFVTQLPGTENDHDTRINMNLLRASNNSWTPGNSWTIYQAGLGFSDHPEAGTQPPDVWFNNVWLGLSPVTKRDMSFSHLLNPTGTQSIIASGGAEGGSIKPLHLVVEAPGGIEIIDTRLLPSNIDDYYLQLYLTMMSQDMDLISTSILREETDWYSHLSFSGNLTRNDSLWRYYAGAINSPRSINYLGSDFVRQISDWSVGVGAVYYSRQDVDYFSQINASVSRRFDLGNNWQSRAYTDLRYAYDREPTVSALLNPPDNYSRVGFELGYNSRASLDIYHYFDALSNSISETLGADFSYNIREGLSLRSWVHPGTRIESRGIGMEYQIRQPRHTIKLAANWVNQTQEYGEDPFFNGLETEQNVFMLRLELSR